MRSHPQVHVFVKSSFFSLFRPDVHMRGYSTFGDNCRVKLLRDSFSLRHKCTVSLIIYWGTAFRMCNGGHSFTTNSSYSGFLLSNMALGLMPHFKLYISSSVKRVGKHTTSVILLPHPFIFFPPNFLLWAVVNTLKVCKEEDKTHPFPSESRWPTGKRLGMGVWAPVRALQDELHPAKEQWSNRSNWTWGALTDFISVFGANVPRCFVQALCIWVSPWLLVCVNEPARALSSETSGPLVWARTCLSYLRPNLA